MLCYWKFRWDVQFSKSFYCSKAIPAQIPSICYMGLVRFIHITRKPWIGEWLLSGGIEVFSQVWRNELFFCEGSDSDSPFIAIQRCVLIEFVLVLKSDEVSELGLITVLQILNETWKMNTRVRTTLQSMKAPTKKNEKVICFRNFLMQVFGKPFHTVGGA